MAVKKKPAGKAATKKAALTEGKQRQAVKPASTRKPKAAPPAPKKARKPRADKGTKVAQPVEFQPTLGDLVVGTDPKRLGGIWKVTGLTKAHSGSGGKTSTTVAIECVTSGADLRTKVSTGAIRRATNKDLLEHGFMRWEREPSGRNEALDLSALAEPGTVTINGVLSGEQLDRCGDMFALLRKPAESDDEFRARIVSSITAPPAADMTGVLTDPSAVHVREPNVVLQPVSASQSDRLAALYEAHGKGWYDKVWIVGRAYGETWDFQGAFWKKEDAAAACQDDTWFIGPADINVALPAETTSWPGCYYPKAEPASITDLASAAPVRHFDRAEDEPAGDTLHKVGDRVWVSVACPVPGAGGQHGTVVDILAYDQGFHVALDNGTDPVIDGEYLHPSVPPRQAETDASHRQYRWGLVAVCLVVLVFVVVSMSGCERAADAAPPAIQNVERVAAWGVRDVTIVTLPDGTPCAAYDGVKGGGIDCDWRPAP